MTAAVYYRLLAANPLPWFLERHNTSAIVVLIFIPIECMLKTLLIRWKKRQIAHKNQMVDHGASNSDTLVDMAVTVYPIHADQDFSTCGPWKNFLWATAWCY